MAGRLETSIWNLTFVATAAACGPTIPIDDAGDESFDDDGTDTVDDEGTTDPPCEGDDCPECQVDADCEPPDYCTPDGRCEYYYTCGVVSGDDGFRCSPPYYECYSDYECDENQRCEYNVCVSFECDPDAALDGTYPIAQPEGVIVDLAFIDIDGNGAQELAIATSTNVVLASTSSPELTEIAVGEEFGAVAAGDIDNDGDLDIVVADRGQGGQLVVVTNDDGVFAPFVTIASPGIAGDLVLGDPENDGSVDAFVRTDGGIVRHADLGPQTPLVLPPVTAMALVGWSLAYSTETGTYWLPVATLEPAEPDLLTEPALQSLSRAQLDGDVDPDLLGVVDMKGGTLLHTWRGPVAESLGTVAIAGNYPHSIAADVNGDGLSEAVVAGDGQVLVLSNAPGSPDAFGCIGESLVSHAAYFMEAGDWDGESGDEVVVSDGEVLTLLHHNGKGE